MSRSTLAKTHEDLRFALARARQEERAANLLLRGSQRAEALKLALRALDSAFWACQLAGRRNEPAAALGALGLTAGDAVRALEVLRRARTLDVPQLDTQLDREARRLTRECLRVTAEVLAAADARAGIAPARVPLRTAFFSWLRLVWPEALLLRRLPRETHG
jgi:hypothetical protein